MELETIKNLLKENHIRISAQRLIILDYLSNTTKHPTADTIYNDLKKSYPILSQATVYNTLNLFKKSGIIKELDFDKHCKRYDFDTNQNVHFLCTKCKRIYDLDVDDTNYNINIDGFKINEMSVVYKGICKSCSNKK